MTEETRPPRNTRGFTLDDPVPPPYVPWEDHFPPFNGLYPPIRRRRAVAWHDWLTWPRAAISDLQADVAQAVPILQEIHHRVRKLELHMADISPVLNKLATDLRAWSAGPFAAVIAENVRLTARNAELEGEDAAETSAANDAVAAFNEMVAPVSESPDVPVEIPPVEVPDEQPPTEPTPAA